METSVNNRGQGPITDIIYYNESLYYSQGYKIYKDNKILYSFDYKVLSIKIREDCLLSIGLKKLSIIKNGSIYNYTFSYFITDANFNFVFLKNKDLIEIKTNKVIKSFPHMKMIVSGYLYKDNRLLIGSLNEFYYSPNILIDYPITYYTEENVGRIFDIYFNNDIFYYVADSRSIYKYKGACKDEANICNDINNIHPCIENKVNYSFGLIFKSYYTKIYKCLNNYICSINKDGFFRIYNVNNYSLVYEKLFFINSLSTFYITTLSSDIINVYLGTYSGIIHSFNINLSLDNNLVKPALPEFISIKDTKSSYYDYFNLTENSVKFYKKEKSHNILIREIFSKHKISAITDFIVGDKSGCLFVDGEYYQVDNSAIYRIIEKEEVIILYTYNKETLVIPKVAFKYSESGVFINRKYRFIRTDLNKNFFNCLKEGKLPHLNLSAFFNFTLYYKDVTDNLTLYGTYDGCLFLEKNNLIVDCFRLNGAILSIYKKLSSYHLFTSQGWFYEIVVYKNLLYFIRKAYYNSKITCTTDEFVSITTGKVIDVEQNELLSHPMIITAMVSKDGILYYASNGVIWKVFSSGDKKTSVVFKVLTFNIYKLAIYKNFILAAGDDHILYLFNSVSNKLNKIVSHTDRVIDIICIDDFIYTLSYDKTIKKLNFNLEIIKVYNHNQYRPHSFTFISKEEGILLIGEFIEIIKV